MLSLTLATYLNVDWSNAFQIKPRLNASPGPSSYPAAGGSLGRQLYKYKVIKNNTNSTIKTSVYTLNLKS